MKNLLLLLITTIIFTGCIIGSRPEPIFKFPEYIDPSSDVIIECSEKINWNIKIWSNHNNFYYKDKEKYSCIGYNNNAPIILNYQKIDDTHLRVILPINITSNWFYINEGPWEEVKDKTTGDWVNAFSNFVKVNYPKTLIFDKNNIAIGKEITITSTKPFFDENTFTMDKLQFLLERYYYIVWIDAKDVNYQFEDKKDFDEYGDPLKEVGSSNKEKYPVKTEYYVIDKITPYSITFKVPPYAKTGIVHVLNEGGFPEVVIPWMSELQPEQRLHEPLVPKNEVAYYSTKEELVILDESGDEIR